MQRGPRQGPPELQAEPAPEDPRIRNRDDQANTDRPEVLLSFETVAPQGHAEPSTVRFRTNLVGPHHGRAFLRNSTEGRACADESRPQDTSSMKQRQDFGTLGDGQSRILFIQ